MRLLTKIKIIISSISLFIIMFALYVYATTTYVMDKVSNSTYTSGSASVVEGACISSRTSGLQLTNYSMGPGASTGQKCWVYELNSTSPYKFTLVPGLVATGDKCNVANYTIVLKTTSNYTLEYGSGSYTRSFLDAAVLNANTVNLNIIGVGVSGACTLATTGAYNVLYITTNSTTASSPCAYTAGNMYFNGSDNCVITTSTNFLGNNVSCSGAGQLIGVSKFANYSFVICQSGCICQQ